MHIWPTFINILQVQIRTKTMTMTSDFTIPEAMLSNPDLTKLYMSASCPELKAESVISSDEDEESVGLESRLNGFKPLQTHDEHERAFSMDPCEDEDDLGDEDVYNEHDNDTSSQEQELLNIVQPAINIKAKVPPSKVDISNRRKLQWAFKGLTLWLELEEFNNDLTHAVEDFSSTHSSPFIPKPHTTAIYGMEHLSIEQAKERLQRVRATIGQWPAFAKPTGVTSDIAECGKPGQVCSIAWSELTLASNPHHEDAMDALYQIFFENSSVEMPMRDRPWKPHNSIAYDNPETNTLSLLDTVMYASRNPTLLGTGRRVEAISLWSTEGKMEDWTCIDRVRFY